MFHYLKMLEGETEKQSNSRDNCKLDDNCLLKNVQLKTANTNLNLRF